ncbi:hypothetical protein TanjilG_03050 [Lupinus angustifolius]|uniref:Uncharacterized protein n=1 Tax=Lupinus angustifolius TaxID=3871 RepID=A0A4P1RCK9_LUPAN|nr:hypothetical protein TanjilG_03050 [Lupinus angustifolius]
MVFVVLLLMLEAAITVDVFINRDLEKGLSLLLAMILKALGPHQYYDSDDEYRHGLNNDACVRVSDKTNR